MEPVWPWPGAQGRKGTHKGRPSQRSTAQDLGSEEAEGGKNRLHRGWEKRREKGKKYTVKEEGETERKRKGWGGGVL